MLHIDHLYHLVYKNVLLDFSLYHCQSFSRTTPLVSLALSQYLLFPVIIDAYKLIKLWNIKTTLLASYFQPLYVFRDTALRVVFRRLMLDELL